MPLEWNTGNTMLRAEAGGFIFLIKDEPDNKYHVQVFTKISDIPITEYQHVPELQKAKDFCEGILFLSQRDNKPYYITLDYSFNGEKVFQPDRS